MEFGLHGQNWTERYIQRNSLSYRDREWTTEELDARTTIFALGDSFTEGWGLNDPADRYTDVLQRLLGDEYAVVDIARAGQATSHQLSNLRSHPYQTPDVVIWQYFVNDKSKSRQVERHGMYYESLPRRIGKKLPATYRLEGNTIAVHERDDGRTECNILRRYDDPISGIPPA